MTKQPTHTNSAQGESLVDLCPVSSPPENGFLLVFYWTFTRVWLDNVGDCKVLDLSNNCVSVQGESLEGWPLGQFSLSPNTSLLILPTVD